MKRTKYAKKSYKKTPYRKQRYTSLYPAVRSIVTSMEEKKHVQSIRSPANTATTWEIQNLLCDGAVTATDTGGGIIQGANENQRVGERVLLKKLEVIVHINPVTANVPDNGSLCRILIVHDREPHLGYASVSNVMQTANDYRSNQNMTYRTRFIILKDFVHSMTKVSGPGSGPPFLGKFVFYPNKIIQFSGAGGVTANIVKNAFYIMYCADDANCCAVDAYAQAHYVDI